MLNIVFDTFSNKIDIIIPIHSIVSAVGKSTDQVYPGNVNGGSTIQLPFGFVQWHQKKVQFHDSLAKLQSLDIIQL